jgi:hypothetical protein
MPLTSPSGSPAPAQPAVKVAPPPPDRPTSLPTCHRSPTAPPSEAFIIGVTGAPLRPTLKTQNPNLDRPAAVTARTASHHLHLHHTPPLYLHRRVDDGCELDWPAR